MKVLVISHTYIALINRDKWKVLAKRHKELQLKIIFPKTWPTHLFKHVAGDLSKENTSNCEFIALDAFNVGNELRYGYYPQTLIRLLKKFQPNIVHVEQGDSALSYFQAILFSKLARIKTKFSFFTWINWKPKFSLKYKIFWKWIEKFNLLNSHGAIAGNQDAKTILQEKGLTRTITVLPQLGVNQNIFKPAIKAHHLEIKKKHHHYIGYVGRITEEKGVLLLAKAFTSLYEQFSTWNLVFVGTGPFEKQLIDFVVQHRLLNRIEFKDPVAHDKVATILHNIDLLVLPSYDTPQWKEQFGHILIEAMACKIPIIGSTGGEIPHVIAEAGLIFQQGNEQALTSFLRTLMSDEALRNKLGEQGYQRAHTHYSHEVIGDKTYSFWKELLNNDHSS